MEKQVLVCYGESRRVLTLVPSTNTCEREALIVLCRRKFSGQLPAGTTLTLQVKSEDWRTLF